MKKLSQTQEKIFAYIKDCIDKGFPPSVREIAVAVGLKSTASVHSHLKIIEEAGYISRSDGLNRNIHIDNDQITRVPIVGDVTAGIPVLATEQYDLGSVPYSKGNGKNLFALKIAGDSMINAGILNDDIVIVDKTQNYKNGDIIVALIDDEATVKRYFKENGMFRLQPENDYYSPIIVKELIILGKVISLVRYNII